MALKLDVNAEYLGNAQDLAQHDYPNDDSDVALNKFIVGNKMPNLFFLNEAGQRCLWGPGKYHSG